MIEEVEIVKITTKGILAEKDIEGTVHIYMQNGEDRSFEFITMNYHYHHTCNSHQEQMTRKILALLGVAIDEKQRPYSSAKICDNALDEHIIANAKLLASATRLKESNTELLEALEDLLFAYSQGTMWAAAEVTPKANDAITKAKVLGDLNDK